MFGELVADYLFLAGVGAGGIAAASLADLLFVRAPFGAAAESSAKPESLPGRARARGQTLPGAVRLDVVRDG